MNPLLLDESQSELRDLMRKALSDLSPLDRVQQIVDGPTPAFDQDAWSVLVGDIGATAIRLPEDLGGLGTGFREVGVIVEEVARALAPVPFLASGVLAPAVLGALGGEAASALAAAGGEGALVAVAVSEDPTSVWAVDGFSTTATATGDGWTVSGHKRHVLGAAEAATLVVAATAGDEVVLLAVSAADADVTQVESLDLTRSWSEVVLADAPARLLGRGPEAVAALAAAHDELRASLALEQAGICEAVLDLTVAYLRDRVQFAQPIGSFQALKHTAADLAVAVDQIRTAADHAARSVGTSGAPEALALAEVVCHGRAENVVFGAMQLLGGIGFTWEHPMHLYVRRVTANARMSASRGRSRETYLKVSGL